MQSIDPKAVWPGWKTTRLIGRGSFGAVYEIERDVLGEKEKAALKLISIPQNDSDIAEMYSDGYDEESITASFQSRLKSIVAEYSLMRKLNGNGYHAVSGCQKTDTIISGVQTWEAFKATTTGTDLKNGMKYGYNIVAWQPLPAPYTQE